VPLGHPKGIESAAIPDLPLGALGTSAFAGGPSSSVSGPLPSLTICGKTLQQLDVNCFPMGTSDDMPMNDAQIRAFIKNKNSLASAVVGS
jgi:hypothetical protein